MTTAAVVEPVPAGARADERLRSERPREDAVEIAPAGRAARLGGLDLTVLSLLGGAECAWIALLAYALYRLAT